MNNTKTPPIKKILNEYNPRVTISMNDESDTERRQVKFQDKKFEVCKKLGISKNLYERKTDLERWFNNNRTAFNQQIHEFLKNITVKSGKNHEVKYNSLIIDLLDKIRPLEDTQAAHQAQDLNKLGSLYCIQKSKL